MDLVFGDTEGNEAIIDGGDHVVQTADEITFFFKIRNESGDFFLHVAAFAFPGRVPAEGEEVFEIGMLGGQRLPFPALNNVGLVTVAVNQIKILCELAMEQVVNHGAEGRHTGPRGDEDEIAGFVLD